MSCSCAAETTVSSEKSYGRCCAIGAREPHDLVRVLGQNGVTRLEHAEQRAAALGADRAVAALVAVHPSIDDLQGLGRVARLVGEDDDADRRGDPEPLAFLGEVRRWSRRRRRPSSSRRHRRARRTRRRRAGRPSACRQPAAEPVAEPREQRVARRMAEAVVVRLEAVQVEEHQHRLRLGVDRLVQVGDERPPVPEPGQQVGLRLVAGVVEQVSGSR